jgi:DeoR family transcriptional regulator, fructose operon transcriptional repressor
MAANALFTEERRIRIVELLQEHKKITVAELCELLKVSPATIRGDLRDLDQEGMLTRTHGGALQKLKTGFETVIRSRGVENLAAKQAIAAAAERLVEDGDTIALDTGTTTAGLARRLLRRQELNVVTNDIEIAGVLEDAASVQVFMLGGMLRKGYRCTVGPATAQMAQGLRVDTAFMGANSFSLESGATTPDLQQAETKKALIAMGRKVVLLCDSSKIGRESFARFADLDRIDVLITEQISAPDRSRLEDRGVEVIVARPAE